MNLKTTLVVSAIAISSQAIKVVAAQEDYYYSYVELIDLVRCEYEQFEEIVDCSDRVLGPIQDLEYEEYSDALCALFNGGSTALGDCLSVCVGFGDVDCNDEAIQRTMVGFFVADECDIDPVEACENFFGSNSSQKPVENLVLVSVTALVSALAFHRE